MTQLLDDAIGALPAGSSLLGFGWLYYTVVIVLLILLIVVYLVLRKRGM